MAYQAVTWNSRDIVEEVKLDKMTANQELFYQALITGWWEDTDTWVYVSTTSFKIVGKDVTAKFPRGTKVRLTQSTGGTKYFIVLSSSFSTDTTVTLAANTSHSLANEAISEQRYSYIDKPQGFIYTSDLISAKAYKAASQVNIADNTDTKVLLDTESWDIGSNFDTGNSRFVAPISGIYLVCGVVTWTNLAAADKKYQAKIYVDGAVADIVALQNSVSGSNILSPRISTKLYVASGKYIELYGYHNSGANTDDMLGGNNYHLSMSVQFMEV